MTEIYGTLGPACNDEDILKQMFACGMTGVRLNLSHTTLAASADIIHKMQHAAGNRAFQFVIDMQGPELRTGPLRQPLVLKDQKEVSLGPDGIPMPKILLPYLKKGKRFTIDDGKLQLVITEDGSQAKVLHGGVLLSRKSITLENQEINTPVLTDADKLNLDQIRTYGVTGIMQPFVRSGRDLSAVRQELSRRDLQNIRIFAKIENRTGLANLDEIISEADEIVIARGDLGNCMPLWHLAKVQKEISDRCLAAGKPFMVVTQMLASMEQNPFPTRAEVSDIFHAVTDGASSVMVTGETAQGRYPAEVMQVLTNTVKEAETYLTGR